jgi:hypothetical protein
MRTIRLLLALALLPAALHAQQAAPIAAAPAPDRKSVV